MDDPDRMLYEDASPVPPELPEEEPPRPWKTAVGRICWGLVLINFTLNFWYLDVILPPVGAVLLWQGLHALRRENGGFRFACAGAAAYATLRLVAAVLQATPLTCTWQSLWAGSGAPIWGRCPPGTPCAPWPSRPS